MSSDKPRVFLSSTIHDFRDLRSALKLWLEEYGYEVLASEMNDFRQLPDLNSFHSCLEAIKIADTFILFIGNRVGGWYDEENRISITRKEFQVAYDSLKQGTLHRLLVFVRQEIWDIREDRKELKRFLARDNSLTTELSEGDTDELVNHPSKFVTDAAATFDFIKEVARIDEMKGAQQGTSPFPIGNWIYRFTSFKDIVDACKTVLNLTGNLRQKALVTNVLFELESNLCELCGKYPHGIEPKSVWASHARPSIKGGAGDNSNFRGEHLIWLGMFLMYVGSVGKRLRLVALQEAITSGEFLEYDKHSGKHVVGRLQQALMHLQEQVDRLRLLSTPDIANMASQLIQAYKNRKEETVSMRNIDLAAPIALNVVMKNVVKLSLSIHKVMSGHEDGPHPLVQALDSLYPSSPFETENDNLSKERPSHSEILTWVKSKTE